MITSPDQGKVHHQRCMRSRLGRESGGIRQNADVGGVCRSEGDELHKSGGRGLLDKVERLEGWRLRDLSWLE